MSVCCGVWQWRPGWGFPVGAARSGACAWDIPIGETPGASRSRADRPTPPVSLSIYSPFTTYDIEAAYSADRISEEMTCFCYYFQTNLKVTSVFMSAIQKVG